MSTSADKNSLVIYRRILRLDELFSAERCPSIQELINDEEVGASRTTIFRTIEFMCDQLHAPVVFDKEKGGYCYSEKTFRLPSLFTTEQELFAIMLMRNMASKLNGTPLYESANSILNFIRNNTLRNPNEREFSNDKNPHEEAKTDWIEDRYVFLNEGAFNVENETWRIVGQAMKVNRQIEFEYNWQKGKRWVKIDFNPWQVVNSRGRWYLWGFDIGTKQRRLFLLDLIRGVRIVSKSFTMPKDFDFRKHTKGMFGAFIGEKECLFKAKFSGWTVPYIRRSIWGEKQKIEKTGDDAVILSFIGTELLPFLHMILSYGKNAVPLEPKELVDLWRENVLASAEIAFPYHTAT